MFNNMVTCWDLRQLIILRFESQTLRMWVHHQLTIMASMVSDDCLEINSQGKHSIRDQYQDYWWTEKYQLKQLIL